MADIELVIKIDEDVYEARKKKVNNPKRMIDEVDIAIANGTPLNEYIDKAFDDLNKCKCGSSYIIIDGKTYRTDIGYAFEGIELFMNYIKGTLSKAESEET